MAPGCWVQNSREIVCTERRRSQVKALSPPGKDLTAKGSRLCSARMTPQAQRRIAENTLLDELDSVRPERIGFTRINVPGPADPKNPPPPVPSTVLDPRYCPVMADLDAIVVLHLTNPFASAGELGRLCKPPKTARFIAALTGSAAYRALYERRRQDMNIAIGLPSMAEAIDSAARVVLEKVVERVEASDDGYLAVAAFGQLAKARGTGGHAPPPPPTVINIDARQAAILGVREQAMAFARERGPYPPEAMLGRTVHEALPVLDPAGGTPAGLIHANSPAGGTPGLPEAAAEPLSTYDPIAYLEDELKALPGASS